MRWICFLVFVGCFILPVYSIQDLNPEKSGGIDSLKNKSLLELRKIFWRRKDLDSTYKRKLADLYMIKAKNKNDKKSIADGYQMFLHIYKAQFEIYVKYSDSIINVTRDFNRNLYPTIGYIFKGDALQELERYNEALESFLKAKEIAESNDDGDRIMIIEYKIAELKTVLGKDREALDVYNKHYIEMLQRRIKTSSQLYIATIYRLADSYNRIKKYDSSHYFLKRGIKYSLANRYKHFYAELVFTSGVNNYYREKYKPAIDSLQKAIRLLDNNTDDIEVRMSYMYLGKSYKQLKNDDKALYYLKKVDSVTNETNYRLEIREAFELLKEYYVKSKDHKALVKLLEKWIRYEKIRQEKYEKLGNEIAERYDIPALIREKEELLASTIKKNKSSRTKTIVIGGVLLLVVSSLYMFVYNRKKEEFEEELGLQKEQIKKLNEGNTKKRTSSSVKLSEELKEEILQKLEKFEKDLGYLKNGLTLSKLSKQLNTNSAYLSKVINEEKQKNYANYINDLRVIYCIGQIQTNKKFQQYAISAIAKEVGFNSAESFAKAFHKNTGVNPAEYIKNIK